MIPGIVASGIAAAGGGGGTLWTPAAISTALWLDADDASTFTLTGSDIDQWADKSGNARHAAPATLTKPTHTASGINSMGSVVFGTGGDPLITAAFAQPTTNIVVAMVWEKTGQPVVNPIPFVKGGVNEQWEIIIGTDSKCYWRAHNLTGDVKSTTSVGTTNPPQVLSVHGASGNRGQFFNGNAEGTNAGAISSFGTSSVLTIGGSGSTNNRLQGQIGEFIVVYDTADITATRQILEGYLAWKWGLEGSLPVGHPYKSAAPTV